MTEALLLQGALGMSEDDISHLHGSTTRARPTRRASASAPATSGRPVLGTAPVELVREVAAAGEVMPPKSTYFFPKS